MTRTKYKSSLTKDVKQHIVSSFTKASKLSSSLCLGKFDGSAISGTALEPLDIFRAAQIRLDEIEHTFIKNAIISLLYDNHTSHHALSAFLAGHFLNYDTSISEKEIMLNSTCVTRTIANTFYDSLIHDDRTKNIFQQVRNAAGSSAHVITQRTPAKKDEVILRQNNIYHMSIPQEFWRYTDKQNLDIIDAGVLVVDGMIISVGEINGFLEKSFKNKKPLMIFCRGFSEEVLATLLQNYAQGKLNVFPIQISMGDTANLLHDIATISEADTISTITGDVLASKNDDCLGSFKRIRLYKQSIEISGADPDIRNGLVKKIMFERDSCLNEFGFDNQMQKIFGIRMNSASGETCNVYVSDTETGQTGIVLDRLDSLGKIHNEIKERGVVDITKLNDDSFSALINMGIKILPTSSLIYAIRSSKDIRQKLLQSSRILTIDVNNGG